MGGANVEGCPRWAFGRTDHVQRPDRWADVRRQFSRAGMVVFASRRGRPGFGFRSRFAGLAGIALAWGRRSNRAGKLEHEGPCAVRCVSLRSRLRLIAAAARSSTTRTASSCRGASRFHRASRCLVRGRQRPGDRREDDCSQPNVMATASHGRAHSHLPHFLALRHGDPSLRRANDQHVPGQSPICHQIILPDFTFLTKGKNNRRFTPLSCVKLPLFCKARNRLKPSATMVGIMRAS
jgi:hypothetical protein